MQAINRKNVPADEFPPRTNDRIQKNRNAPRRAFLLSMFLGLSFLLAGSFGCAPARQNSSDSSASNDLPEITEEIIRERINEAFVRDVPEENGAAEPVGWRFREDEPKEITVVEKQLDGARAIVILDIKTKSASYMRNPRSLAGQIRTVWELKTGWMLRQWEIVRTENISLKYKNLPKPPVENKSSPAR